MRLDFERGTATNIYVWNRDEKIIDVGARPYQSSEFISTGNGEFRSYNIRSGGGLRVRREDGALVITTPHGIVRLTR
jgi:hypothetical protein